MRKSVMNTNKKKIYSLTFVLIYFFAINSAFAEKFDIEIESNVTRQGGNYFLNFKLSNNSQVSYSIFGGNLPWNYTQKLELFLVDVTDQNKIIEQALHMIDPAPEPMTFGKEQSLEGAVKLATFFPEIDGEKYKNHELLLFWSYLFRLSEVDEKICFSGYHVISDITSSPGTIIH